MSALAVATRPADQSTDDLDLVEAVRAGDDRAFEVLFLRYQSRIAVYVRGMVRDHGRAEDITQEVFMAALRRIRETDREIAFKPWIYEIAKNACIDAFRRGRLTSEVSFDGEEGLGASDQGRLVATGVAPEAVIDNKLALDNLCGAFGGLSQAHHDILVMREFEGLSYREIGDRLGMSQAAVESTLFRARRRLSEEYEELISGERCVRVRGLVDAPASRAIGLRDRRRMARHLAHCQPCRRYAHLAGADLDAIGARPAAGVRIAALLPLPAFLRRRLDLDASPIATAHAGPVTQWTASVSTLDPAAMSGWAKAVATAATVAVASLGAGAAVSGPGAVADFISRAPALVGLAPDRPAADAPAPKRWSPLPRVAPGLPTAPAAGAGERDGWSRPATGDAPAGTTPRDAAPTPPHASEPAHGAPPDAGAGVGSTPDLPGAAAPDVALPDADPPALTPGDGDGPVNELLENSAGPTSGGAATALPDVVGGVAPSVAGTVGTVTGSGGSTVAQGGDTVDAGEATGGAAQVTDEASSTPSTGVGDTLNTVVGGALGASSTGLR